MKETIFVEMTRIIQPTVANDMVERTNLNYHIYCQYVAPALRMNLPYFTCTFLTPPSAPPKDLVVMTDLSDFKKLWMQYIKQQLFTVLKMVSTWTRSGHIGKALQRAVSYWISPPGSSLT